MYSYVYVYVCNCDSAEVHFLLLVLLHKVGMGRETLIGHEIKNTVDI
jgi:hypothetical protein